MVSHSEELGRPKYGGLDVHKRFWPLRPEIAKGHVLVVDDEEQIRDAMGQLLDAEGYDVSLAEDGREALRRLYTERLPDVILLDLRMPVMDGWRFRTIQKDDPRLGRIPVVAISADGSAQAAAISAQAYLRKPIEAKELLVTIERVLFEDQQQKSTRLDATERLASLGRLAAGVGHEINNPLAFVMLNLGQSVDRLRSATHDLGAPRSARPPEVEREEIRACLASVTDMLEDCQVGSERIRETVGNLQRLSRQGEEDRGVVDVHKLIDQSVSMVWNQIRHRARLIKTYGRLPPIRGSATALGQVFLNLLVNAAQALPEGDAERNEIRVSTTAHAGEDGAEVMVEISDSGAGIAPDNMAHIFEPFFTTKPIGQGTGLGLSVSRQTISDHGGRITVESAVGKGTVFRLVLPVGLPLGDSPGPPQAFRALAPPSPNLPSRGRVLVIDDEALVGRAIRAALGSGHDVCVVQRASEGLAQLERGAPFDLVLCDVAMPDLSGPQIHRMIAERWPQLVARMVFMTGGAFTPETVEFLDRLATDVLYKPFTTDRLKQVVGERMRRET